MAYIVQNEKDMAGLFQQAVADLRLTQAEMAIVPMLIARTPDESLRILCQCPDFDPRRESDQLPSDAVGIVRLNAVRTVHDALDDQQNLSVRGAAEMLLMAECAVGQHVPGQTRRMDTIFGQLNVHLEQYALRSGLPLRSPEANEYATFLLKVPSGRGGGSHTVAVLVKGTRDTTTGGGDQARVLVPLLCRLESRKRGFDDAESVYVRDLPDGWHLLRNTLFAEACGWFRVGYHYSVEVDGDRGGLNISY